MSVSQGKRRLEAGSPLEGAHALSPLDFLVMSMAFHGRVTDLIVGVGKKYDLDASETLALHCLTRGPELVSEVAGQVGLRPNGASVLISRLVKRRLVRRQRTRSDRRVALVSLTESGRKIAASAQLELWRAAENLLLPLQEPTQRQFLGLLDRLASHQDEPPQPITPPRLI